MKKIRIAHLYYDLMNLYGENGNLRALQYKIEEQKQKCVIDKISLHDDIDFQKYDIVYMGCGTEDSLLLALEHLLPYKDAIKDAASAGTFFFLTGNALEIFGNSYQTLDQKTYVGLGLLSYDAKETQERIVGEQFYTSSLIKETVIGFQNRKGVLYNVEEQNLFTVVSGHGYAPKVECEGVWKEHVFATYLLGPIFIRNPYFTDYLLEQLFTQKKLPYTKVHKGIAYLAYEQYLKNFVVPMKKTSK